MQSSPKPRTNRHDIAQKPQIILNFQLGSEPTHKNTFWKYTCPHILPLPSQRESWQGTVVIIEILASLFTNRKATKMTCNSLHNLLGCEPSLLTRCLGTLKWDATGQTSHAKCWPSIPGPQKQQTAAGVFIVGSNSLLDLSSYHKVQRLFYELDFLFSQSSTPTITQTSLKQQISSWLTILLPFIQLTCNTWSSWSQIVSHYLQLTTIGCKVYIYTFTPSVRYIEA